MPQFRFLAIFCASIFPEKPFQIKNIERVNQLFDRPLYGHHGRLAG